ncbi:hypothetical protein J4N45_14625 [Vibrio sp. SCSIO 43140]|uniref:hypothetical protein n=1 Tax=Vibrio sp. SCSIO 43140 TaxID=2819100 RepID=UPI002075A0CF|nr:hypothetical protein [Vibrio sp. SCSIO 43140]USD59735.1 hypothetical protein J4N45_14625 [Vibrio sp. SCSIO 43140]
MTVENSEDYQKKLQNEFDDSRSIVEMQFPMNAKSILLPPINGSSSFPERKIVLNNADSPFKITLFKVVIAACNYAFFDKGASITAKEKCSAHAHTFIEWLDSKEIDNEYELLKEYESYRFDMLNNHGGRSVLSDLKLLFTYALDYSVQLQIELDKKEILYLQQLRATPISPNLNKKQISLFSYFGKLDWLRRDDVGIGNELYVALASPRITVNSLKVTASVLINEINKSKQEIVDFFNGSGMDKHILELPVEDSCHKKKQFVGETIYKIINHYHDIENKSDALLTALKLIIISNVSNDNCIDLIFKAFDSKEKCQRIFLNPKRDRTQINTRFLQLNFTAGSNSALFDFSVLRLLSDGGPNCAVTKIEELMFSWLMASLAVQPSDISKLTNRSFRFLKKGDRIKHIETEYFKGRSKLFHTTNSVSGDSPEGKAILLMLSTRDPHEKLVSGFVDVEILKGVRSKSGAINALLYMTSIRDELLLVHKKRGDLPYVIPSALVALFKNGLNAHNLAGRNCSHLSISQRRALVIESGTACQKCLFGLQAI